MMQSSRRGQGGETGTARRRLGTLLALLALLSQMAISLLPMPAMAGDGTPVCTLDGSGHQTAPAPGDAHGSHAPDCPACQAAQLLGSLVPPSPLALPVEFGRLRLAVFPSHESVRPQRAAAAHQARAPPPSV
jgi:Protein of unknown function (DUF2946)